jgi:hypothetical protein
VASGPGATPDLEDEPEVLIWMWMLRVFGMEGSLERSSERPWDNWVAFLGVSTEETQKRLGIVEVRGLHLSVVLGVRGLGFE